ncbi:hypothetical protein scyTo_0016420 [Scyliorhinus torazame]|uniref:Cytochrome c oxidase assembly factor 5 n=1 Tax=Scyliorhinus torazame TaxID=75743 RepID=A0A401PQN3_SCYTO|nr:hypothetical protein [Scyliorhinus torazame]
MPKYYEEKEEDGRACARVREDLRACLLNHDCVLKEGKTPKQCLKEGHCKALQVTFFECKRSMLDNRTRFRGRKGMLQNTVIEECCRTELYLWFWMTLFE